ncbi:MAG: D-tyrosyl-tRNA(Tyr) deacylase [Candidatus Aureabacteria bacterium]|nr:D-tyrosyl-tRNA(Tyr) deacylase [Candidatus Auribacterota bacterium]
MKIVAQRVKKASVFVDGKEIASMNKGTLIYFAAAKEDNKKNADWLADKILSLRIFEDEFGKMNRSLIDVKGSLMVVPQFTLYGNCRKGKRPGFDESASPETANELFKYFVNKLKESSIPVYTGKFRSHMEVTSINDGPVTFIIEK